MKTGTIILGILALIFGIDTVLSAGDHMTISEWINVWLHTGVEAQLTFGGIIVVLVAHFWYFRPKNK